MYLYTLTPEFMPKDIVNEFISAIWTERYFEAGEVQLVTPATPDMINKLADGTFLALQGTKEVMILNTQSIENEILTVTGQSLLKFLDERQAWFKNPDLSADQGILALTADTRSGELISSAVDQLVINPIEFTEGPAADLNLNWDREIIHGLEIGLVDDNGGVKRLTLNLGGLYNAIKSLAQQEGLGLKLYLESSRSSTGPIFRFATYRGKNRTSQQSTHALVRLTPKMDSLSDVKEISSISNYKNVVYVVYHGMSIHYAEPSLPIPIGFDRRVLIVEPEDIYLDPSKHQDYRDQAARDAFANNDYISTIDGQASPQGIYQYGVDYGLGDIIELEGATGVLAKARITEYIRAQDKEGEREYPSLSVVDHLSTGMLPDTEPDDIDTPGEGDPVFDDDIFDPEPEPEPGPDVERDPNEDPRPDFDLPDLPDPEIDPDIYTGPNPNGEPYVMQSGPGGIEVTDTFPPFNHAVFSSALYEMSLESVIKIKATVPDVNINWSSHNFRGPIAQVALPDWNGFVPMTYLLGWAPGDTWPPPPGFVLPPGIDLLSSYDIPPEWQIDPGDGPGELTRYARIHAQWSWTSVDLAPFSIPKWPYTQVINVTHFTSGPIDWIPRATSYYDHPEERKVTNEWQAIPRNGDVWLNFSRTLF